METINIGGIPIPNFNPEPLKPYFSFRQGIKDILYIYGIVFFIYLTISYAGYISMVSRFKSVGYPIPLEYMTLSNTLKWYEIGLNWEGAYNTTNSLAISYGKKYFTINTGLSGN